jgi:hypothetical protein
MSGAPSGRHRGYISDYKPSAETRRLLADVEAVLEEYRDHWPLAVRQIFYRLIGAHGYDKSERFYGRLCHHLANARRGRAIPFEAIRDDGVSTVILEHFTDADEFRSVMRHKAQNYRGNLMAGQPFHVEVWCEAAGMLPQLAKVAHAYSVQVYSSSGFDSLTAKKRLAERICEIGKPAIILHLGDFDPSGASMFDVIGEDVGKFVEADRPHGMVTVEFRRVALTAEQVESYALPTAPAKATDSRAKAWSGETCQLEALAPDQIADLLREAIDRIVDRDLINLDLEDEAEERHELTRLLLPATAGITASRNNGGWA